jgi:hypothetical protein
MVKVRLSQYRDKRKNRILSKTEKTLIMNLFIQNKMQAQEIGVVLNLTRFRVNSVLFNGVKPFKNFDNRGVCAFAPKTAYWETEQELIDSFEPQYKPEDLKGWEAIWIGFASGEIKTKTIMSKFK